MAIPLKELKEERELLFPAAAKELDKKIKIRTVYVIVRFCINL